MYVVKNNRSKQKGGKTISQTIDSIIYSDDLKTVEGVEDREITAAVIKDGVTAIGKRAFCCCRGLQSIEFPSSLTTIGCFAFEYCHSLQNIVIPSSVTAIEISAFEFCDNLQSIVIPPSVTEIGNWAFKGCKNLQNIELPSGMTTIGADAFYGCKKLSEEIIAQSKKENRKYIEEKK